jgi:hypothetical protein
MPKYAHKSGEEQFREQLGTGRRALGNEWNRNQGQAPCDRIASKH